MAEVEEQLKIFLEAGLAPNTRKAYVTGQNAWASFIALNEDCVPWLDGVDREGELRAERQVMRFAMFLAPFIKLATIRNYISGVRSMHVERLGFFAWEFGRRLPQLLKGIARVYPAATRKRAPVTLEVLRQWFKLLDFTNFLHVELWVAILLAFFGLMRKSEFAVPVGLLFNPATHLSRESVVFLYDPEGRLTGMKIWLARAKCDQEGVGCWIHFAWIGGWLCPVAWMSLMLRARPRAAKCEPLFKSASGLGMSTLQFSNAVERLASLAAACEGADVTAHSLRIGGAMALFEAGASDSVIMMLGRWKGSSFRAYLRSSAEVVMHWNRVMAVGVSVGDPGRPRSAAAGVAAQDMVLGGAAAGPGSSPGADSRAATSTNSIPPAVSRSTSEIMRQWLGGICHPLLSPDSREKERSAAERRRAGARSRGRRSQ